MGGLRWFGGVVGLALDWTSSELGVGVCKGLRVVMLTEWLLEDVLECVGGVGGKSPPLMFRRWCLSV